MFTWSKQTLGLVFLALALLTTSACGDSAADQEKEQQKIEEAKKADEEKKRKEAEAKAKEEEAAKKKQEEEAAAAAAADEQAKEEEAAAAAAAADQPEQPAVNTADATAANTPEKADDDGSLKLGIKEYASNLFGYQVGQQPTIVNQNWEQQLTQNFNQYNTICQNNGLGCPINNYQMFVDSGAQLGNVMFDNFYQAQPNFLTCNGNFNDYFGGFVRGGWLNEIQVVINVMVFFNGRLINQENYNENQYAPVVIHQLLQAFKAKYQQVLNGGYQHGGCYTPPMPQLPAPCQIGGGVCGYGNMNTGHYNTYPYYGVQHNTSINASCNLGCGNGYYGGYNNGYYGNSGVNWSIGAGGTNYDHNSSIGWGIQVGGSSW